MNSKSHRRAAFSKRWVQGRTAIPREVREQLKLKPGDTLRYRMIADGILLDKPIEASEVPFAAFSEWTHPRPTKELTLDCNFFLRLVARREGRRRACRRRSS
jgi:antitoxin PrlF